jgi:tryptophanyl-tRNA synthetase
MKKQLAEDMINFTAPFREKINELTSNDAYLGKVVHLGAQHARESASRTIREVREIIGFKPF